MNNIGLIGLGVMGQNFSLNIADKKFKVGAYNRTYSKTEKFITESPHENITGYEEIWDLVKSLETPRKIILLVKAGIPTDATIDLLIPLLNKEDSIIDCGNSHYKNTESRIKKLQKYGIHFIGSGISGGEEWARHGPSLMPGWDKKSVDRLLPIWEAVSAKDFSGKPCTTNVGKGSAGNFVKMVHNGIEYSMMQAIAEIYDIHRKSGYSNSQIHKIFQNLNSGLLESFLLEITTGIFHTPDDLSSGDLIDKVLDRAKAKGTGGWTVEAGMNLGVPVPSIAAAVIARQMSARNQKFSFTSNLDTIPTHQEVDSEDIKNSLLLTYICSYLQWLDLIVEANEEYNWNIDIQEVIRIWQGGCIIRSKLLEVLPSFYRKNDWEIQYQELQSEIPHLLKSTVNISNQFSIPLPVLRSVQDYVSSIFSTHLPSNLIQAQRDAFGAHTYRRNDREGVFHSEWK